MDQKRKKVLYVITKSNFGGAQRYVYDLATSLPKDTYEPVVAFGGTGEVDGVEGKLGLMLKEANVRTIFIKNFTYEVLLFKEFAALRELVSLFRKERPDIVHLNSSKAGGLGALAARIARVPKIVYITHGWAHNEPVSAVTKMIRWVAELGTVLLTHKVIAISHFEMMHTPLGISSTVIHNGVAAFTPLSREEARNELEKRYGIPKDVFIVGSIAELHPSKGLDNLIHAATLFTEGHIVIMGEGESKPMLEAMIKRFNLENRVHLLGFVDGARKLLAAFDVFVLPSRKEGLGYVLLEAGSVGLPVVSTTVGGIPEIIEDEVSGELVHTNDCPGLARALQKLYDHSNTRTRYGEELKRKVDRYFNLRGMVKRTIEVYEG